MLKALRIENFRGIKKGALEDLAQINLLAGQNNSGKSTILESLIVARTPFKQEDLLGRGLIYLQERRIGGNRIRSYRSFFFRLDTVNLIKLQLIFPDEEINFEISGLNEGYQLRITIDGFSPWIISNTGLASQIGGIPKTNYRDYLEGILLIDAESVRRFDLFEEKLWRGIFERRADKEIREIVNEAYGLEVEGFTFPEPGRTPLYVQMPQYSVPVDVLGEGLRYVLSILSAAVCLKRTALLIEELEVHQHPDSLEKMLKALFMIARRNELQLFISTQSGELIAKAIDIAQSLNLELRIFHLILNGEGELVTRALSAPDAKLLSEIGPDIRMLHKYVKV